MNGAPMTSVSVQTLTVAGTATPESPRAAITRNSRATSWADGVSPPSGGRRRAQSVRPSLTR